MKETHSELKDLTRALRDKLQSLSEQVKSFKIDADAFDNDIQEELSDFKIEGPSYGDFAYSTESDELSSKSIGVIGYSEITFQVLDVAIRSGFSKITLLSATEEEEEKFIALKRFLTGNFKNIECTINSLESIIAFPFSLTVNCSSVNINSEAFIITENAICIESEDLVRTSPSSPATLSVLLGTLFSLPVNKLSTLQQIDVSPETFESRVFYQGGNMKNEEISSIAVQPASVKDGGFSTGKLEDELSQISQDKIRVTDPKISISSNEILTVDKANSVTNTVAAVSDTQSTSSKKDVNQSEEEEIPEVSERTTQDIPVDGHSLAEDVEEDDEIEFSDSANHFGSPPEDLVQPEQTEPVSYDVNAASQNEIEFSESGEEFGNPPEEPIQYDHSEPIPRDANGLTDEEDIDLGDSDFLNETGAQGDWNDEGNAAVNDYWKDQYDQEDISQGLAAEEPIQQGFPNQQVLEESNEPINYGQQDTYGDNAYENAYETQEQPIQEAALHESQENAESGFYNTDPQDMYEGQQDYGEYYQEPAVPSQGAVPGFVPTDTSQRSGHLPPPPTQRQGDDSYQNQQGVAEYNFRDDL